MKLIARSVVAFPGRRKVDDASAHPAVQMPVSVMFRGNERVYDGTIAGLLASQRGRRIALLRLAVEEEPLRGRPR